MKKFTKLIALFLAILSLCAVAMPAMAATATVTVDTNPPRGDGGTLNLRSTPSSSGAILARIPNRSTITVTYTNKTDIWYKTTYNGYSGYVMSKFMRFSDGTYGGTSGINNMDVNGCPKYLEAMELPLI